MRQPLLKPKIKRSERISVVPGEYNRDPISIIVFWKKYHTNYYFDFNHFENNYLRRKLAINILCNDNVFYV